MKVEGVDTIGQTSVSDRESSTLHAETIGTASGRYRRLAQDLVDHGREYAPTFITEFAVMASQIVAYKLAAHYLGRDGFSEYALARRTASLVYPPMLLGLGVALPRYIGFTNGVHDPRKGARYFGAAVRCVGLAGLIVLLLMNLFRPSAAYLFFGNQSYLGLVFPLSLLVFGLALHAVTYSYFRGNLLMKEANLLQFVNLGIIPLAAFFFFRTSLRQLLITVGSLTTGVAMIGLAQTPWTEIFEKTSFEARELLRYGLQRVPGDLVHMALLTLPATFAAHLSGMRQAGNVAFGVSILSLITAFFTPVGLILLPKASRMLAEGAREELLRHVIPVTKGTIILSASLTLAVMILAGPAIRVYLGPGYADAAWVVRILILGAVPYSLFLVFRSIIDAAHEIALTALILMAGFSVFCFGAAISSVLTTGTLGVLLSLVAGMAVLGILASRQTARILFRHRLEPQ